jgi:hypothetical protein
MFLRFFTFLIVVIFCTSCDKLSFSKTKDVQVSDTISDFTSVDFTSVDFSPSFKVCDSLIDKEQKSNCFRETIHKKIGEELQNYSLTIKDSIDEIVYVDVLINSKGEIIFKEITSTENLKQQLPELDSLLRASVKGLPIILPAIKRGIPVTTSYRLPVRISLK